MVLQNAVAAILVEGTFQSLRVNQAKQPQTVMLSPPCLTVDVTHRNRPSNPQKRLKKILRET